MRPEFATLSEAVGAIYLLTYFGAMVGGGGGKTEEDWRFFFLI